MAILVKNAAILTMDRNQPFFEQGCIEICDEKISYIGESPQNEPAYFDEIIDARGRLAMPGLINAHCHSYANYVKGLTPSIPLESWMLYIMAQGQLLSPEDVYWNTMLGALEMLKSGTSACIDHLAQGYEALDAAMQAYSDIGMRAALAPMISDKPYHETLPLKSDRIPAELMTTAPKGAELIDTSLRLLRKWHRQENGRLMVFFGPSGPQRCTDELLAECGRLAREHQTNFHSHVLESAAQAETARLLYGEPMVLHLAKLNCLGPYTTLVHAVWLNDEEIAEAARLGAVVVHNPASNFLLGSGIAPVNKYRQHQVTVAIGTDGVNLSGNHSLFGSIQLAAMIHNPGNSSPDTWIQPLDALEMATLNGALALADPALGCLRVGQKADITILRLENNCLMTPLNDLVWQLAHSLPHQLVESVIVNGKPVLKEGKPLYMDEEKILAEAERRGNRIKSSFRGEKEAEVIKKISMIKSLY